ncbi:ribosomal protein l34 [Ophiostoma piceae UAMH 11346]|uniref:Ribosomal protein l34 n=1 Tax=Ophiostoma piceae (strain UAMH 11346) TaxID=1262450 RepID=S3CUA7_OPHP1|nr:ribosomal protein l34 [Ophiostoma piceae UAMH 11346]
MFAVRPVLASAATRSVCRTAATTIQTRCFSILPRLRPTTPISSGSMSVFRSQITPQAAASLSPEVAAAADLVSPSSISRHPAFTGFASQIRCGPRPTMAGATRLVQKRRHGFLSRVRTKGGKKTLARRRTKGRKRLSA